MVPKHEEGDEYTWSSRILQRLISRFPDKINYKRQLALEYYEREEFSEAIKMLEDLDQTDTFGTIHELLKHKWELGCSAGGLKIQTYQMKVSYTSEKYFPIKEIYYTLIIYSARHKKLVFLPFI